MSLLGDRNAVANLAVKNLNTARRFYEDTLGLAPVEEEGDEVVVYKSGDTVVNVYRSQYAGTNEATAVTWPVGDDIEEVVGALRDKGVTFEHYDMPGMTLKGDIHVADKMKVAWFKDPDGNILNLINM
jgi:catechol 2,3-dioxygenase-like lactoylglutathione lyase family enzyme